MPKRIFNKNYDQTDLIKAKNVLSVYTREVSPNGVPNEELWRQYKETKDDSILLQYIVNNRGYFIVFLANFFSKRPFSGDPTIFAFPLFAGVKNSFEKSAAYVKSYIARGVLFELMRTYDSTNKDENECAADEFAYEDESYDETIDRLYHTKHDEDYIILFSVIREVIEKNPHLPPSRLRKVIVRECKRRGLYLSLYEYLQEHDLRLPE